MIQNKNWFVIVNPVSGTGTGKTNWNTIAHLLRQHQILFNYAFTNYKGHIKKIIADESEKGNHHFLICGGDGSLSEAVNAVMNLDIALREKTVLGVIPVGSGNDWCRTHNISFDYKTAIKQFASGCIARHDVGCITLLPSNSKQYFINIAGSGYNAHVAKNINKHYPDKKPGKAVYMLSLLKYLANYTCDNAIIRAGGITINQKIFSVCFAICKYNGGGMMQAPQAVYNDGLLAVNIILAIPKWRVILNLPRLKDGSWLKNKWVISADADEVYIEGKNQFIEADGESLGYAPAQIGIYKQAIQMILPT